MTSIVWLYVVGKLLTLPVPLLEIFEEFLTKEFGGNSSRLHFDRRIEYSVQFAAELCLVEVRGVEYEVPASCHLVYFKTCSVV